MPRQAHGGVRRDRAPLEHHVADAWGRYPQSLGERVGAETQGLQEVFLEDLAGVDGAHAFAGHRILFTLVGPGITQRVKWKYTCFSWRRGQILGVPLLELRCTIAS